MQSQGSTAQAQAQAQAQAVSAQERAALLALLPGVGRERAAVRAHAGVVYARMSTDGQDSIPAQLEAGRSYAQRNGIPVSYELEDTGSGLSAARADYQRMLSLAEGGQLSHVIVFKADRLSRDDAEFVPVARRLMALGIEIHDTTSGRLTADMVLFTAFMANVEVRNISQRTTMGLAHRARKGMKMGSPLLGYRRTLQPGVYAVDEDVAPVIVELFERYRDGAGLRTLCTWLNQKLGLPRPPAPGMKRGLAAKTPGNLRKVLTNPSYKGVNLTGAVRNSKLDGHYARPRDQWEFVRNQSPAIVPTELWDAVQARMAQNGNVGQRDRAKGVKYTLAGLIWCARCRRRMAGHHSKGRYNEYVCGICTMSRSQGRVESIVRAALRTVPIGMAAIDAALARDRADDHGAVRAQMADVERRLATLVQRRVRLTELYADGKLDADAYTGTLGKADAETKDLRAARAALEQSLAHTTAADAGLSNAAAWLRTLSSWVELLDHATADEQRTIYRETIARITIDAQVGTLTVTWTPPIARLCGGESYTVPLPGQPSKRLVQPRIPPATVALLQHLAQAEPRPTAKAVQRHLAARGITLSQRTIQRYAKTAPARRGRPPKTS